MVVFIHTASYPHSDKKFRGGQSEFKKRPGQSGRRWCAEGGILSPNPVTSQSCGSARTEGERLAVFLGHV